MHQTRQVAISVVLLAFVALTAAMSRAEEGVAPSSEKERELIALLRSDAPPAEKALACKHLSVHGSSAAVPELARLLPDEHLASWARIALEVIPGPAADEALRKSLDSLEGKLLVGAINSIGVRRDADAVEPLIARLSDNDAEVGSAAAVALGHIGNAAAKALRRSLTAAPVNVRSAVAEGCVLCAERFLSEGNAAEATEIFDEVRKADVPRQRVLEATRGAILSRGKEGIPLLVEQFQSPDKSLFQIALTTAREFPGRDVDQVMATEMVRATPERATLLIQAMADRKETVVLPAVLKAAGHGPKSVRVAAIGALGRVGDASCLSPLFEIALDSDADVAQTAKVALGELPGDNVDKEILSRLSKAEGKMFPLLIEVVGQRRIDAVAALLKAVGHSDEAVRSAALTALGATVDLKRLSVLIAQVVAPKHAADAPVAQLALRTACVRMPDREACAEELATAIERASVPTKATLLQILGAVGGTKALETIGAAAKSTDPQLQDASTRLLGEWMTIDAAPVLLDLAKTAPGDKFQVRAMRGYIRISRQFIMPDPQRVEMCQKAFDAARHPAEQKLVFEVLKRHPSIETLKLAIKAMQNAELKEEATQVALAIAQKVGGKGAEARDLLAKAGFEKVKLEIIKAEYGAGATQKDVTELLQQQVGDLPMLTLSSASYNTTFGGDPAPNTPKKLRIQYKINGKAGEASFAEDALIILPMPK